MRCVHRYMIAFSGKGHWQIKDVVALPQNVNRLTASTIPLQCHLDIIPFY